MTSPTPPGQPALRARKVSLARVLLYVAAAICLAACFVVLPCVGEVRGGEGWIESAVSLKRIGLALRNYHKENGRLPPAVVHGKDGRPLYSWRVLLLP